jgi:hypothetical protein
MYAENVNSPCGSAGRGGNKWESPKGCLMFSYTLQMEDGRSIPFLQYVVSLAVIEGIEAVCSSKVCSLYSGGRYSTLSHSLSSLQQFWEVDVCNPNHSLLVKS